MKRFTFLFVFGLYFGGTFVVLGQKKDPVIETIKKRPIKTVAFELVHNAPQHPECDDTSYDPQGRRCLTQTLVKKISSEFNTRLLSETENGQRRIIITMLIDENGKILFTNTNSKDSIFNKEIKRIIATLPKLKAATHMRGPAKVRLRLPMTFVVSD
ncbi:hypothetical protein ABN763_12610 [Spongiivirga sp. MCCC 1A20706]|uniref:hypothetical protein n=1 Tax=Spongiivirga sp. MCCC 1A20706 TaxID=3160963 RepID=UPI003977C64B